MPRQSPPTQAAAVVGGSALFRGLADPSRLAILLELRKGERRVVDLTAMLGLALAMLPVILWQGWETLGEAREHEHEDEDVR